MGVVMLKKMTFRRISLSILLLLLAVILYHYPEELNKDVNDILVPKIPIYLVDENGFVARSMIENNSIEVIDKIKAVLDNLIIGCVKDDKYFRAVIPEGTKIKDIDLNDGLLKINFSKELLNVAEADEVKMIEAIVYSVTEFKEVNKVMIFVEQERLAMLPHSKKKLDLYLDRSIGINKVYDIDNISNTQMTTIYYLAKNDDYYYVPVSFISNSDDDKISIIIRNLKTNTLNNSNLLSHLNYQVELMNYEINKQDIELNFNSLILDGGSVKIKEEVKYALAYSLKDSLGANKVTFLVDSVVVDEYNFF